MQLLVRNAELRDIRVVLATAVGSIRTAIAARKFMPNENECPSLGFKVRWQLHYGKWVTRVVAGNAPPVKATVAHPKCPSCVCPGRPETPIQGYLAVTPGTKPDMLNYYVVRAEDLTCVED